MQMWYCSVSLEWNATRGSRRGGAASGRCGLPLREPFEPALGEPLDRLVLEVAGRRDHDRARQVAGVVVRRDRVRGQRRDHLAAADHGPPERMVAEDGRGEDVVHLVLRLVLVHRDLLEHHLALGLEVRVGGAQQHVAHHLERALEVLVEEVGVQDRRLLAGGRVDVGAEAVELLRDLLRGQLGVPLNSMCSRKCEMPACSSPSSREPTRTHRPSAIDRTDGTRSVTTRMPESSSVRVCS